MMERLWDLNAKKNFEVIFYINSDDEIQTWRQLLVNFIIIRLHDTRENAHCLSHSVRNWRICIIFGHVFTFFLSFVIHSL